MATRPPTLLVHGAFSKAGHFEPWSRYLAAAGDATTVPSLPGHDPSDARVVTASGMPDYPFGADGPRPP
jgi:pimeloyl-ACP methyl ester carboxylesterase